MNKIKVFIVFGTRPEAIKLAPIIKFLKVIIIFWCKFVGRLKKCYRQLELFRITPDVELDNEHNQSLSDVLNVMINGLTRQLIVGTEILLLFRVILLALLLVH